ncbi:O-antigen ligase family protein [Roseateles sp. P5_E1]
MYRKSWDTKLTAVSFGGGLLMFICMMPFYSAFSASAHDLARLAQIPLFLLATIYLLLGEHAPWARENVTTVGVLVALMLLSALHAHQPAAAFRELSLVFSLFFLTLAIGALRKEMGTEKILLAIVLSWLVYEIFFLLAWSASALNGGVGNFWLMVPGFDNPRFLNHAQTPAVPLLIGIASDRNHSLKLRRFGWVAATFSIAILIGLASRASSVALVLSALGVAVIFRQRAGAYLKCGLISLTAASILYFCVFYAVPLQLNAAAMTAPHTANDLVSDHSRIFLWKIAIDQLMSSPLLGVGPMHFSEYINLRAAHPHNMYFQILAEYGLPIALLIFYWLLRLLWEGIRRQQAAKSGITAMAVSATAGVLALAIDGFFSGNFVMPVSQVWICIAIALFAKAPAAASARNAVEQPEKPMAPRLILLVLLIVQLLFSYSTIREYEMPRPTLGQRPASPASEPNNPRFWLDGWL